MDIFQFISISWRIRRYFPKFAITPFLPNFALFSELWQEAFDRVWSYQLAWLFNLQLRIIVFLSFRVDGMRCVGVFVHGIGSQLCIQLVPKFGDKL